MFSKTCVVPSCNNDDMTHPEKKYLTVPKNAKRRENWAIAIGVDRISFDGKYCVCEDHFDLSEDSTNWLYYTMVKQSRLVLKPDVVPHKHLSCPTKNNVGSQLNEIRNTLNTYIYNEMATSSENVMVDIKVSEKNDENIGVKPKQGFKHVSVQTNIKKHYRSKKINTAPVHLNTLPRMSAISVKRKKRKCKRKFPSNRCC